MDKKRIILIKTNLLDRDPRLAKEIDTLSRGGYVVTLLCWDRDCKDSGSQKREIGAYYKEIRLKLRAPWGLKVVPFLPIWWCFEFFWLVVSTWDVAHAINFDCVIPAVIIGKFKRRPIIYEIFDVYADQVVLPRVLREIGVRAEKSLMCLATAIIVANEAQPKEIGGIPNSNVVGVYNSPPDLFKRLTVQGDDTFTIFFAGVLQRSRRANLDKVCQAIRDIGGARLIIAGYGDEVGDIKRWVKEAAGKAKFIGKISYAKVLEITMRSDLLFVLYDPIVLTTRYAGCNKLFEAMMCHKPILVSKRTAMADIVEKENCGLAVDSSSVEEIQEAVVKLKEDPELYCRLGANGRRAYEKKYSWEIMEQRLIALYQQITK